MNIRRSRASVESIPPSLEVQLETFSRDYEAGLRNEDRFSRIAATTGCIIALAALGAILEQGIVPEHSRHSPITETTHVSDHRSDRTESISTIKPVFVRF